MGVGSGRRENRKERGWGEEGEGERMHTHRDNWVFILGSLHLAMYVCSWKLSKKGLRMGTLRSRPQG